jgi:hypothetical protein
MCKRYWWCRYIYGTNYYGFSVIIGEVWYDSWWDEYVYDYDDGYSYRHYYLYPYYY